MKTTRNLIVVMMIVFGNIGLAAAQDSVGGDPTATPVPVAPPNPGDSTGGEPRQPIFVTPDPNQGVPDSVYADMTEWYEEHMVNPCGDDPNCVYVNQVAQDWENITVPAEMPQTSEELMALLGNSALSGEFDMTTLLAGFGESNQEAYSAIVGFAATHLGAGVNPVYAQKVRTGLISAGTIPPELTAQLSPEIQMLIAAVEASDIQGATYYALLNDGFSIVYTASDCSGSRCTVDLDTLQYTIEDASLGVYARYYEGTVASSSDAYNLIVSNFPTVAAYPLTPVVTENGYAFSFVDTTLDGGRAYFVGVTNVGNRSVVYAATAVGEGYIGLGLGQ